MATQTITLPPIARPIHEIVWERDPQDLPIQIDINVNDKAVSYVPVALLESERALNAELVEALKGVTRAWGNIPSEVGGDFAWDQIMQASVGRARDVIAKAEAREKGD